MKLNKLIKPLTLSCLAPISLLANADEKMNFVTVRAGVDQPIISSDQANATNLETGFVGGLEIGRKINNIFAVGLEYSHRAKNNFDIENQYTDTQGAYQKTSATWAVKSHVFMLNLITNLVEDSKVTPYIKLGIGAANNKSYDYVQTSSASDTSTFPGKTKNNFAWQVGAGLNTMVSNQFDVDFAYSYLNRGKVETEAYYNNSMNNNNPYTAKSVKLADHTFTLGVKFKF